jgi:hypothetical protein
MNCKSEYKEMQMMFIFSLNKTHTTNDKRTANRIFDLNNGA